MDKHAFTVPIIVGGVLIVIASIILIWFAPSIAQAQKTKVPTADMKRFYDSDTGVVCYIYVPDLFIYQHGQPQMHCLKASMRASAQDE